MTRLRLLSLVFGVFGVFGAIAMTGCNKPNEDNCRKALANMQSLLGTENVSTKQEMEGEVRRCKGGSSREAVDCAIKATSLEGLRTCGFMKLPEAPVTPAPPAGSAAAPAGSDAK